MRDHVASSCRRDHIAPPPPPHMDDDRDQSGEEGEGRDERMPIYLLVL